MKTENNAKGWPEGWLVAAAAAAFAAVMARVIGDLGLFATLMVAIFVFLVFGVLLGMFWGTPVVAAHGNGNGHGHGHGHGHAPEAVADGVDHGAASGSAVAPEAVATDDGMAQAPVAQALLTEPGIAEEVAAEAIAAEDAAPMPSPDQPVLAAPEAVATDDGMAQAPVAQALMADPAAEMPEGDEAEVDGDDDEGDAVGGASAPRRTREERIAARAAKAARQAAKAARAEQAAPVIDPAPEGGRKPQGLSAARSGQPDNLQTIEGIGPVLEKLCHELGIYHFDQIAGWGEAEIAWMDGNLKGFKGRVTRDKWVRQAALIGEVGMDEFLRRAKSNDY